MNTAWHIWSNEHQAWWKPEWEGYTKKIMDAGIYSMDEAIAIINHSNQHLNLNEDTPVEVIVPSLTTMLDIKKSEDTHEPTTDGKR